MKRRGRKTAVYRDPWGVEIRPGDRGRIPGSLCDRSEKFFVTVEVHGFRGGYWWVIAVDDQEWPDETVKRVYTDLGPFAWSLEPDWFALS